MDRDLLGDQLAATLGDLDRVADLEVSEPLELVVVPVLRGPQELAVPMEIAEGAGLGLPHHALAEHLSLLEIGEEPHRAGQQRVVDPAPPEVVGIEEQVRRDLRGDRILLAHDL